MSLKLSMNKNEAQFPFLGSKLNKKQLPLNF
jgi:hypothetical protein